MLKKRILKEIMEKKLSFNEFKNRVDFLRDKVDSFSKDWQVASEYYICYSDDLKLFNRNNKIVITMMDKRNGEITDFVVRENFTDIWILANFFYLSRQEIKEIINSIN